MKETTIVQLTKQNRRSSLKNNLALISLKSGRISLMKMVSNSFIIIVIFSSLNFSQVIYQSNDAKIYNYLNKQFALHTVNFPNEVLPLSEKQISILLRQIDSSTTGNTEFMKWYYDQYNERNGKANRFHAYQYLDSLTHIKIDPLFGYTYNFIGKETNYKRWWGIQASASISDWFGLWINFRDQGEFGKNIDKRKEFTPTTGHTTISPEGGIEYSDVRGGMSIDWNWGNLSFQKDYIKLGHGQFGQLIHSNKAPSYPFVRFSLSPAAWFRFTYIHGWLNSNFIDSIGYYQRSSSVYESNYQRFVKKFIALNLFTIVPYDNLDISFGNSAVYKGELKPEMFLPFMFFKYLDRDLGKGSIEDSNGQLFFDVKYSMLNQLQFYYSFFLDVTSIRELVKGEKWSTWYGLTLGGTWFDFISDFDIHVEYSRITPWLYEHKDSTTTYKHLDYVLGHWLGQNAEQLRLQIDYMPDPKLFSSIYFEYVQKGGIDSIETVYKYKIEKPFLYPPVRKEFRFGFEFSYEYMHDLTAKIRYEFSDIKDDDTARFAYWMLGKNNSFSFTASFGF